MDISDTSSQKEDNNINDNTDVERIYIGGLHPPHLTVPDMVSRLKESLGSVIEILPDNAPRPLDDEDACYVHLNVRRRDREGKSALEHVSKLYHNVTWKGCKLRVEAAKPHFIERLHQEIQEREQQKEESQESDTQQQELPVSQRRHLKIRERHGEQVFSVDTKPYEVEDWRNFNVLRQKLDRRKQYYLSSATDEANSPYQSQKAIEKGINSAIQSMRSQSKMNRAVHLRLATDGEENRINNQRKMTTEADDDASLASSSSMATSASEESTNRSDSAKEVLKSTYVWSSSDEDDDDDDDDSLLDGDDGKAGDKINKIDVKVENKEEPSASTTENPIVNAPPSGHEGHDGIKKENTSSTETSAEEGSDSESASSETSSDTDEEFDKNTAWKNAPLKRELESSHSLTTGADNIAGDDGNQHGVLQKDVESNLDILVSLFPDMKKPKPRKMTADGKTSEDISKMKKTDGWSAGGTMLRYDPTKDPTPAIKKETAAPVSKTTKQPEAEHTKEEDKGGTSSELESDDDASSDGSSAAKQTSQDKKLVKNEAEETFKQDEKSHSHENEGSKLGPDSKPQNDEAPEKNVPKEETEQDPVNQKESSEVEEPLYKDSKEGNVYKQDKLEDVFREARVAAFTGAPVVVQDEPEALTKPGAFSFGFEIGNDSVSKVETTKNKAASNSGGFSFSFFPEEKEEKISAPTPATEKMDVDNENEETYPVKSEEDGMQIDVVEKKEEEILRFRRRGMMFPTDVLHRYQEDFYIVNDGLKILQDLERYHKDDEVKEHWHQERQTLTQDWRRKRKFALQTRNKHQKMPKHI